ncbi:MAG: Gfo/Idh/MocA family oxidoreductase [Proteobacteria bacterium]|nr:Gfo/Idh/MocA family oxidoreductase [Pseudomonadota bacterium]MBI3498147.1 Gfo/Idh/MocA family oxidoreductase [Pseudomonadota bacterium]
MPLAIAILGVAHWHAPTYAQILGELGHRVVGSSDGDATAGALQAQKLGLAFESSTEALLDRTRPDFVFVLPRHDRVKATLAPVLERRLPFLLEKPMGLSGAQSTDLASAAASAGVFAAAALANRHLAIWAVYRRLQAEERLGTVMHAHFRLNNGPPERYRDLGVPWMLDPVISGGGPLRNLGIHATDAVLTLADGHMVKVQAAQLSHRAYHLPVEEFATALLQVEGGPIVTLEAGYSYAAGGGDFEWRIAATGATMIERKGLLAVRWPNGELTETKTDMPGYRSFVLTMLADFQAGRPPVASLSDCAAAAMLIDRIYAAAKA